MRSINSLVEHLAEILKETYQENLTFSVFKCYNWIPSASTNPENMKSDNPVTLFW